ncbi:MAG: ABC transporter ATP-binding protein [Planctomycetes bacterium]|nr:ABC transporter ATP-binding protein [Planctomycetota bacterium]
MPVLVADRLAKRYGAFQALSEVSLSLEAGEIVGFLGPNGAGKSTTMKILTGFVAPTAGTATVAGHDLAADPLACRRAIGYLPEELPLYLDMTVTAYLDHVARLKGVPPGERRREVVAAIEAAWLGENAHRHIRKLSKGNRQRVGVAQALIGRPPILILDEPTSGLDPSQVANFRELVKRLAERHTILLSTHILAEVEAVCGRVVVVHRGRTIVAEPIDALRRRATRSHRVRLRLRQGDPAVFAAALAALPWAAGVALAGEGVVAEAGDEHRAELVALAEAHGGLRELVEERLSLEEVFRDLIAGPPQAAPAA